MSSQFVVATVASKVMVLTFWLWAYNEVDAVDPSHKIGTVIVSSCADGITARKIPPERKLLPWLRPPPFRGFESHISHCSAQTCGSDVTSELFCFWNGISYVESAFRYMVQLMLSADFMFYYVKGLLLGNDEVVLPQANEVEM